jgi:glycosyltransferase involved in cell wall biosynthesis
LKVSVCTKPYGQAEVGGLLLVENDSAEAIVMRVVLDLRAVHARLTGIGRYAANLLYSLERIGRGLELVALTTPTGKEFLGERSGVELCVVEPSPNGRGDLDLPDLLYALGADVFHSPLFVLPPVRSCPCILTVHDVIPAVRPDLTHESFSQFFHRNIARATQGAARLITVSLHSQEDLIRVYPQARARTISIHEPVSPIFRVVPPSECEPVLRRFRLAPGYLLSVGAIDHRKNLTRLLEAYDLLRKESREVPPLVVIGEASGDGFDPRIHVARLHLGESVRFLGRVPDEDLACLYSAADILVFPSLYEGFGLPVVEAMASGTAVVTSNVSSLPEIAGDAALLVDPMDVRSISQAMKQVLADPALKASLVEKGLRRARSFSLERQGERITSLYQDIRREAA